jgi:methylmalonyl-CoA mutase N-terminal domain/subunit
VDKQKARLQRLKEERDNRKVEEALQELRQVTEGGGNVMPAVIKAVKVYATIGEISKVWKSIFGPHAPIGASGAITI